MQIDDKYHVCIVGISAIRVRDFYYKGVVWGGMAQVFPKKITFKF